MLKHFGLTKVKYGNLQIQEKATGEPPCTERFTRCREREVGKLIIPPTRYISLQTKTFYDAETRAVKSVKSIIVFSNAITYTTASK